MSSVDRQYVSRFANEILGVALHAQGVPQNADGAVEVALFNEDDGSMVLLRNAKNVSPGNYETQLSGEETSVPGQYVVRWRYSINGVDDDYQTYILIGESAPAYDRLDPAMKSLVDYVWIRFADLFDSPTGGPNLQTYAESHFTRGRIADLLRVGVGRLNTVAQPHQTFTVEGTNPFPVEQWGPLLEQVTYVECIKHLMRSYVEQPLFQGGAVTRLDRRDYLDRWRTMLQLEEQMLKTQLDVFKVSAMRLGRGRVLVSGGVFGRYAPTRYAGGMAARGRMWARYF